MGFGSTEAFARAFKTRFGATPSVWRQAQVRNRDQLKGKLDQALFSPDGHDGLMKVKIIDRQPTTVAYLRHVGPYGAEISHFWMTKVGPWMQTNDLFRKPRYGISHDDPGVTDAAKLRYDAAVEVPDKFVGAGDHQITELPGGKYATARFKGTDRDLGEAWNWLLRDWAAAVFSSTRGRRSSTTPSILDTTPRPASSSVRSASRSRRCDAGEEAPDRAVGVGLARYRI